MSINPPRPASEDPYLAVAIARAERRRAALEELGDIGMGLARQIGAHAAASMAAVNEAHGGDPGRAFAAVSRAVRMTLALESWFDDQILILRQGIYPTPRVRAAVPAKTVEAAAERAIVAKAPDPRRDRVDVAVREAIHLEVETITVAREKIDALHERLFDSETYDALLDLPFRGVVAAICADLGLQPDWQLWSDDVGFVAPPGRRRVDWTLLVARSFPPGKTAATKTSAAKPPPIHRRE